MTELRIARRFCGPPDVANGGYVSGCVAKLLGDAAEVTLRAPTPVETELVLEQQDGQGSLRSREGALLVEASSIPSLELPLPAPVSFDEAVQASANYVGFRHHPYPGCFVCGPARSAELGPGLALFPGGVEGKGKLVAAPWRPARELCDEQGILRTEFIWAALDCPSWFGHAAFVEDPPKILLGRLTARLLRRPKALERCVVHGFALGQEGRRILCGSAISGEDGAWLAFAKATWVELKAP